jgi:hypothetical protein
MVITMRRFWLIFVLDFFVVAAGLVVVNCTQLIFRPTPAKFLDVGFPLTFAEWELGQWRTFHTVYFTLDLFVGITVAALTAWFVALRWRRRTRQSTVGNPG